jgi:hypothetical protein
MISIRNHAQLSKLVDLVPDPKSGMIAHFFLVIKGIASNIKMITDAVLVLQLPFQEKARTGPNSTYQPGNTNKVIHQIFKCCKI